MLGVLLLHLFWSSYKVDIITNKMVLSLSDVSIGCGDLTFFVLHSVNTITKLGGSIRAISRVEKLLKKMSELFNQ